MAKNFYNQSVVFDYASTSSNREYDANGFLHAKKSAITREGVFPYFGKEIPDYEFYGLEPERVYGVYRPLEEIAKAKDTFKGMPVLNKHVLDGADLKDARKHRVGTTVDPEMNGQLLEATVIVQNREEIDDIEKGAKKELSSCYFFKPVIEDGEFEGTPYQVKMTEIKGNHVALVEQGRSGSECSVSDGAIEVTPTKGTDMAKKSAVSDEDLKKQAEEEEAKKKAEAAKDEDKTDDKDAAKDEDKSDDDDDEKKKKAAEDSDSGALRAEIKGMGKYSDELVDRVFDELDEAKGRMEKDDKGNPVVSDNFGKSAMDANTLAKIKSDAVADGRNAAFDQFKAFQEVQGVIGASADIAAFDSADAIYKKALETLGFAMDGITDFRGTYRAYDFAMKNGKSNAGSPAMDKKPELSRAEQLAARITVY